MGACSTLRVAVGSVELLTLARVRLIARFAFFAVGFGVGGGGADLHGACGRCDEADHAGAEELTSPHCCLGPLAHRNSPWSADVVVGTRLGRGMHSRSGTHPYRASTTGSLFRGCRGPQSWTHCYPLPFATACLRVSFIFSLSMGQIFLIPQCLSAVAGLPVVAT